MKKIFASLFTKKHLSIALVVVCALAVFASSSGVALAAPTTTTQTPSVFSCIGTGGDLATCLIYGATWFAATIIGLLISLGAVLIKLGLAFNANVYNSPFIQTGFSICLSIANLGFIIALIVIAIATILQRETYGYKKTLWRLVAMAILVNFGLVITAPIISFANSMTSYFVSSVNGTAGIGNFTSNMAQAFAPQALAQAPSGNASSMCSAAANAITFPFNTLLPTNAINSFCSGITGQSNPSPATSFSQALLSLVFQIIFSLLIAIAFFGLGALLLVRYVWLGVLLVVLPFAWLAWIFPGTSRHFSKWWSDFIKWAFFPPAALFFVYLAMLITAQTPANSGGSSYLAAVGQSANNGAAVQSGNIPEASIAQQIGQVVPIESAENDIIIIGLMLGGLMMASSFTGKAGAAVVEQAKNVSGAIQGYVGKKTKRVVGDRLRSAGRRTNAAGETTTALQRLGARLQGTPGLRGVGATFARAGSTEAMHAGKEEDIKKYIEHNLRALPDSGLIKRAETDSFIDQTESAAIGQELAKRRLTADARVAPKWDRYVQTMGTMGNLKNEDVLKALDNAQLTRAANSPNAFLTDAQAAAIAQEIAKRNLTSDPTIAPLMAHFMEAAQRVGKTQDLLNNRPDLVRPRPGETRDQALLRAVRGIKDIVQIDHRVLDLANAATNGFNPDEIMNMTLRLSSGQINKLAADGNSQQNDNLRASITDIANRFTAGTLTLNADQQNELNRIIEVYRKAPLLQPI